VWLFNTPYAALYAVPLSLAACWLLTRAHARGRALGFLVSGVVAGCAILFKHTLGLLCVGGLGVAIWCVSVLEAQPRRGSRSDLAWALGPLVLAALAILVPFASMLSLRDYLMYFLPYHVLLAGVAALAWRERPVVDAWAVVRERVAPFALGALVAPAGMLLVYALAGGVGDLLHGLFVLPLSMQNYDYAAQTPPGEAAAFALGTVGLVTAALLLLGGRRTPALALAVPGAAAVAGALALHFSGDVPLAESGMLWLRPALFEDVFGPAIVLAAVLFCVFSFRERNGVEPARLAALLPLLFLGCMLLFQAFPRASVSSWIVEAAVVPVLAWLAFRWSRLAEGSVASAGSAWLRPAAAMLLVLLIPLWMVQHAVAPNNPLGPRTAERRALTLPGTAGIALDEERTRVRKVVPLEALVAHLEDREPRDAPVFLLGSAWMTVYLSGRPLLFPERTLSLHLSALGMLPSDAIARGDEAAMIERLRETRDVIVIEERGPASERMRSDFPRLGAFVDGELTRRSRFGPFRVLRRPRS